MLPADLSSTLEGGEKGGHTSPKENLAYQGLYLEYASRYQSLGWRLAAVDARVMVDLGMDFKSPPETWPRQMEAWGSLRGRLGLGVYAGSPSRLLILETQGEVGEDFLESFGPWRSQCRARMPLSREQHYYALPAGSPCPPTGLLRGSQVMVYGEGGLIPVPPTAEAQSGEVWSWLSSPWESPLAAPPPAVWAFLQQHLATQDEPKPEVPSWEEIYPLVISHEKVLQALLAPAPSLDEYYRDLLQAALASGFRDRSIILGLLRHAPQGDALQNPERWLSLRRLVATSCRGVPGNGAQPLPSVGGKQVLLERSRYETLLYELKKLAAKTAEIEALLLQWGQDPEAPSITPAFDEELPLDGFVTKSQILADNCRDVEDLLGILGERVRAADHSPAPPGPTLSEPLTNDRSMLPLSWSELPQRVNPLLQPEDIEASLEACLQENPELAGDPLKVKMVHYCFKNYVNLDPDMADLPLRERVVRASRMAREFLGGSLRGNS